MLDLQTAKALRHWETLYTPYYTDSKGYPVRVRITSIKTWKTRPNEIEIKYKYGLYDYGSIKAQHLDQWTNDEEEARLIALDRHIEELTKCKGDPKSAKRLHRLIEERAILRTQQQRREREAAAGEGA